jgi:starch synthase
VHNLAYQGNFQKGALFDLGLPAELFTPDGVEFYGQLSFMKAGLQFADVITTVSPTYAREIQTPAFGERLDGLLKSRAGVLHGVLNGIDTEVWDPATDRQLPARFRLGDMKGKAFCRRELRKRLGLPATAKGPAAPLFAFIGRLVDQKGVELLLKALPPLLEKGAEVVVLGTGEAKAENALAELSQWHPRQLVVRTEFDETLAHWIQAGSDFLMMPSKFEPCGLNQMYAMRYGTVPVVHATGGLDDSVTDLSRSEGTGIKFNRYTSEAFGAALEQALALHAVPEKLSAVREFAMAVDHSWGPAAAQYESLYI